MAIRVYWGHMEPHFGGRRGRRGSAMAPLERAMVVSYIAVIVSVTIALSPNGHTDVANSLNQRHDATSILGCKLV